MQNKFNKLLEKALSNKNVISNDDLELIKGDYTFEELNLFLTENEIIISDKNVESNNEGSESCYYAYIKEIPDIKLTREQIINLGKEIKENKSKEAFDLLISSHLKLVINIAKKYINKGLDLEDLIQEGNLGIIEAAKKYDYRKNLLFSTYAYYWIRKYVIQAIQNQGKTIRIPIHKIELTNKIKYEEVQILQKYNRIASNEEIAEILKKDCKVIKDARENNVIKMISMESNTSTFKHNDKRKEYRIKDFVKDDSISIEDTIANKMKLEYILKVISKKLTPMEQDIIYSRYLCDKPKTLNELSIKYNYSKERIRQFQNNALEKIKKDILKYD